MLREAIFSGRFQPGEALREMHLARLFEVSQATVREALVQLEHTGLVVREKNRKTTVTTFTPIEIRHRLMIRVVLEELAFSLAASNMDETDFRKLSTIAQTLQRAIERGNWKEVTLSDLRFHEFVWQKAESPVLYQTLEQLTTPLFAFIGLVHERKLTNPATGRPHEDLVAVLRAGNDDEIRKAIRGHVEKSYVTYLESGMQHAAEITSEAQA